MKVKDVMHHSLVTAPMDSTLEQAARLMWEFDCGIVPIVDDAGRLAGVVTDRDICMAAYTQGRTLRDMTVASCMATAVVAAHTEDTVENAERLLRDNQIHRVPVLDQENYPVGIVSVNDLARLAARGGHHGERQELAETLAAICEPRNGGDRTARLPLVRL